ncbi:MAG: hypothetical protein FWC66_06600 [Oscillospiraceae bacterium]|nr:hypothetical protein [Oscillospiraceae bacterium]
MSDLFEKRTDGGARREARNQKEQLARRKSRTTAITVISVLIVLVVGAFIINSNFLRQSVPAITISGRAFSAAEFDYFYNTIVHEHMEAEHLVQPAHGIPLAAQLQNHETGTTWADFFVEQTKIHMSELVQMYNAARSAGFEMSDEDRQAMDSEFSLLMMQAGWAVEWQGFPDSLTYLRRVYGSSITENILRDIFEFQFTAMSYSANVFTSPTYAQSELEAFYLDRRHDLDVFRYRFLLVQPELVDPMQLEPGQLIEEAQQINREQAAQQAELIAASITTEEEFIAAALELNADIYSDPRSTLVVQQGSQVDPSFEQWVRDEARQYGDTVVIEFSLGYFVLLFVERDDNNYYTTAMRQILLLRDDVHPEDFPLGQHDPEYLEAREIAETEARARAEAAYAAFQAGNSSEQAMINIIPEFSDEYEEDGFNDNVGFYEDIARFEFQSVRNRFLQVVPELQDWLFDESRELGDSALVRTELFGYHLVYFAGRGENMRQFIAEEEMMTRDHAEWIENLPEVEVETHFTFRFTTQ